MAALAAGCAPARPPALDAHIPPFARLPYQRFSREAAVQIALGEWRAFRQPVVYPNVELPEDEEREPDPDELVLWGDEQFAEFARLLHIRNAAHSYDDAKHAGLSGFVEQPDQFIELAFAPPLQALGPLQ